jgi:TRAP-type C4-dicarboxylate transport system permease small subunit
LDQQHDDRPHDGLLQRILLFTGSCGLLTAMATDALAVLGRHTGFAVNGAIEIFQVCAVVALSSAILLATLTERHAMVDLLAGRLSDRAQHRLAIAGRLAAVLAFAVLTTGTAWVSADLGPTHEMTEQLAIPLLGFRLFWLVCCAAATVYSVVALVREVRK